MSSRRLLRSSWQRVSRPRNWNPHMMQTRSPSASHVAPKTGGFRAVRHLIAEVRAREAEQMFFDNPTLTVKE